MPRQFNGDSTNDAVTTGYLDIQKDDFETQYTKFDSNCIKDLNMSLNYKTLKRKHRKKYFRH